jgi:hypothetical protein
MTPKSQFYLDLHSSAIRISKKAALIGLNDKDLRVISEWDHDHIHIVVLKVTKRGAK